MELENGSYKGAPCQVGGWGEKNKKIPLSCPKQKTSLWGKKLVFSSTFSPFRDPHMSKPRCPGEAKFSSIAPLQHQPCPSPQLLEHGSVLSETLPWLPEAWYRDPEDCLLARAQELGGGQKGWTSWDPIWMLGEIPNNGPAYLPRLTFPHLEAMQNS